MSSTDVWWKIGDALNGAWFYDNIGDIANWSFILLGAFGFVYWMLWQKKFNDRAANDPNQIK